MWNEGDGISVNCPLCKAPTMARQQFMQATRTAPMKSLGWYGRCECVGRGSFALTFKVDVKEGDAERTLGYAVAKV